MICTYCGNEMYISGSTIRVKGDTSPQEETVVERVLQFICRNPQCSHPHEETEEVIRLY